MDAKVKALWLAALRDGSFEQGRTQLRDFEGRCDPIGVLCELAVSAGVQPKPIFYGEGRESPVFFGYAYHTAEHTTATRCPKAVYEWAGIGYWTCNRIQSKTDNGMTFAQIADWIEAEL